MINNTNININEIIKIRGAVDRVIEDYNINIDEEIERIFIAFDNREELIDAYLSNRTSDYNMRTKTLEDLLELMGDKNILGIDITPILKTEAILEKYEIVKKEIYKSII